jgi:hypothetical protein
MATERLVEKGVWFKASKAITGDERRMVWAETAHWKKRRSIGGRISSASYRRSEIFFSHPGSKASTYITKGSELNFLYFFVLFSPVYHTFVVQAIKGGIENGTKGSHSFNIVDDCGFVISRRAIKSASVYRIWGDQAGHWRVGVICD